MQQILILVLLFEFIAPIAPIRVDQDRKESCEYEGVGMGWLACGTKSGQGIHAGGVRTAEQHDLAVQYQSMVELLNVK